MGAQEAVELVAPPRSAVVAGLVAMRPHQWTKNLLVLAGVVFAAKLGDGSRLVDALVAFVVYCAVSSAAYIGNDVVDREPDRLHPVKRDRPLARGDLPLTSGLALGAALAAAGLAGAAWLGLPSLGLVAGFLALQAAYSLVLKHLVLIDVLAISALFVLRAAAGAVAVDVEISPWLLMCTGLLALFLALGKRAGELDLVSARDVRGRPVLDGYSRELVDQLLTIVAAATIVAYALYTFTARESSALMATIPFVVFGIFRYLLLLHRKQAGEEPETVLLRDRPILVTVLVWAVVCAVVLALD